MKVNEKIFYSWSIFTKCVGQKYKSACRTSLEITGKEIVKKKENDFFIYGFICPKCGAFTKISQNLIPPEIKRYCYEIKK